MANENTTNTRHAVAGDKPEAKEKPRWEHKGAREDRGTGTGTQEMQETQDWFEDENRRRENTDFNARRLMNKWHTGVHGQNVGKTDKDRMWKVKTQKDIIYKVKQEITNQKN